MAALFTTFVGTSRSFETQGSTPGRFKFGTEVQTKDWSPTSRIGDAIDNAIDYWGNKIFTRMEDAANYATELANQLPDPSSLAAAGAGNPALQALAAFAYLARAGAFEPGNIEKPPTFRSNKNSPPGFWDKRAEQGLTKILADLGIVTSVAGGFADKVVIEGTKVESGSAMQLGDWTISGIAFEASCNRNPGRHGLEAILEYYYYHRVSNVDKPMTVITISIGKTQLKGWLHKVDVRPMNLDFNLWSWDLGLYVDPRYIPKPITGPLMPPTRSRQGRTSVAQDIGETLFS